MAWDSCCHRASSRKAAGSKLHGSWPHLILMAKSAIHAIHVWHAVESLVCQRAGRRENDLAISNTIGYVGSPGTSPKKMERLPLKNSAVFLTLPWRGTRGKTAKPPRFTKIGQEPAEFFKKVLQPQNLA